MRKKFSFLSVFFFKKWGDLQANRQGNTLVTVAFPCSVRMRRVDARQDQDPYARSEAGRPLGWGRGGAGGSGCKHHHSCRGLVVPNVGVGRTYFGLLGTFFSAISR